MITSNIFPNTFFFTKSEQCPSCGLITGYKTADFIPFTPFFIPFYTTLYLTTKHIISAHSAFQPFQNFNYTLRPRFFKFIPCMQLSAPFPPYQFV